jgi:hypothetical protein
VVIYDPVIKFIYIELNANALLDTEQVKCGKVVYENMYQNGKR